MRASFCAGGGHPGPTINGVYHFAHSNCHFNYTVSLGSPIFDRPVSSPSCPIPHAPSPGCRLAGAPTRRQSQLHPRCGVAARYAVHSVRPISFNAFFSFLSSSIFTACSPLTFECNIFLAARHGPRPRYLRKSVAIPHSTAPINPSMRHMRTNPVVASVGPPPCGGPQKPNPTRREHRLSSFLQGCVRDPTRPARIASLPPRG